MKKIHLKLFYAIPVVLLTALVIIEVFGTWHELHKEEELPIKLTIVNQSEDAIGAFNFVVGFNGQEIGDVTCRPLTDTLPGVPRKLQPGETIDFSIAEFLDPVPDSPGHASEREYPATIDLSLNIMQIDQNGTPFHKRQAGKVSFDANLDDAYEIVLRGSWDTTYTMTFSKVGR